MDDYLQLRYILGFAVSLVPAILLGGVGLRALHSKKDKPIMLFWSKKKRVITNPRRFNRAQGYLWIFVAMLLAFVAVLSNVMPFARALVLLIFAGIVAITLLGMAFIGKKYFARAKK